MKNTTICVTGGCGAIGISLVQFLLNQNPKKIIKIDNLSSGSLNYLPKDKYSSNPGLNLPPRGFGCLESGTRTHLRHTLNSTEK